MISTKAAKLVNIMPKGLVTFISKKIIKNYLDKYASIEVNGLEKLKTIKTPTIFVCNHLSNSDGLVLDKVLKEIDPTFVAGVKLSDNSVTNIGLNVIKTTNIKPDSSDKEGLKKIVRLVKGGESLLIFPEGTRSRVASLIEAKRGILLIARMTGVPLTPVGIYGTEKLLPISKDGDMSSENFNHADVFMNIGDQFTIAKKGKDEDKKEYESKALETMMKNIAALLPEEYRGVYK